MKMSDYLVLNANPDRIDFAAKNIEQCRNDAMDYAENIKALVNNSKDFWTGDAGNVFMERCNELNKRLLNVVYETLTVRNALLNAADKFRQIESENIDSFNE